MYNAEQQMQEGYDKCKYEYSRGAGLSIIPRPALSAFGAGWCLQVIQIYNNIQMHRFLMEKQNGGQQKSTALG
jgi:hypothetical protein